MRSRAVALAGALAGGVFAACKEPPLAPGWDTDLNMPLSAQAIHLDRLIAPLTALPPGSAPDSFAVQPQDVSGVLGDLLKNLDTDPAHCTSAADSTLSCDHLTVSVTKTTPVAVTDTLFVANSRSGLTAAGSGTIVFAVAMGAAQTSLADTLYLQRASVQMLQTAGQHGDTLFILLRGRVTNASGAPIPVTGADSIGVSLSATIRVAVSHQ